jgi:hypothetical protein
MKLNDGSVVNDEILADYPVAVVHRWMSAMDPVAAQSSPTYIGTNADGWWDELEKVGKDYTNPLECPDALTPISQIDWLKNQRRGSGIVLDEIQFIAYDVKRTDPLLQTPGVQNTATNTALTASIATQNNIVAQASALNAVPVDWQPNWFNPVVKINGKSVWGVASDLQHPTNVAYQSIGGLSTQNRRFAIYFKAINDISITGCRLLRRVRRADGTVVYNRVALMAELIFRMHW